MPKPFALAATLMMHQPHHTTQIVDFGLGVALTDAAMMRDIVGTWIYMSPEVFKGKHNPYAVDM